MDIRNEHSDSDLSSLNHPPCSQQPSALPYIGAYLDQIYSLEMNSKTCNPDGLVNFAKND